MAEHIISFADKNLLNQVVRPEILAPRVPRIGETADGIAQYRAIHNEISTLGRFTRAHGFSSMRDLQHVAFIPSSVRAAIMEVDPEILTNKKKFYEALNPGGFLEDYDLRGKITL